MKDIRNVFQDMKSIGDNMDKIWVSGKLFRDVLKNAPNPDVCTPEELVEAYRNFRKELEHLILKK